MILLKIFKFLKNSVINNYELIFVNNGADKNEFNVLDPFIDTYIQLNKNSGAYLARNIGASFCKCPNSFFP